MQLDRTTFEFTSKEKESKVTLTATKESSENNTVQCIVTNLSGECEVKFDYKLDSSSDFENFGKNLTQGLCPQFWLHVAKMYQLEIDNLAFDLERRYHYFQNDCRSNPSSRPTEKWLFHYQIQLRFCQMCYYCNIEIEFIPFAKNIMRYTCENVTN